VPQSLNQALQPFLIIVGSLMVSMVLFGVFVAAAGVDPFEVYQTMYRAAFGTSFSWQNTLIRAAPLMLTALCTALPGYLGLIIIGGEGAVVMGGLFATIAALAIPAAPPMIVLTTMAVAGMAAGGLWLAIGGALRHYRAVNETISSLLLNYIAVAVLNHLVTSTFRDPESLNHPSTHHIGEANMIGAVPGTDLHWGFAFGVVACIITWFLMHHTVFGFASQIAGGNVRAAQVAGLPVGRLILIVCFVAGAAGGLAGMVEVAAVHGRANDTLNANYGYAGILVAFVARNNPLAIIPVAVLLGGIRASSGLLQRAHELPDATVLVMQGVIFLVILFSETLYGRFSKLQSRGG
jgi:general nucleoside transport system permease protein